jgi:hypothetical protein
LGGKDDEEEEEEVSFEECSFEEDCSIEDSLEIEVVDPELPPRLLITEPKYPLLSIPLCMYICIYLFI